MDIKTLNNKDVYTDFKSLNALHHELNANPDAAKKEVAEQFESLLVQMMMKSMRDANQALASDSDISQQSAIYHDLLDKQLSLVMAHSDTGLAKVIEASLNRTQISRTQPTGSEFGLKPGKINEAPKPVESDMKLNYIEPVEVPSSPARFDSASEFVNTLWASAKEAAALLGTDPKFLLAQAALETNWGKAILPMLTGGSSNNLFNIKADRHWEAPSTQIDAIEFEDGIMVKNKSKFRAYASYQDSFSDYVHFLKNNSRYGEALKHAADPAQFAQQLQKANYATDANYSEKIMQIYHGKRLNELIISKNLT